MAQIVQAQLGKVANKKKKSEIYNFILHQLEECVSRKDLVDILMDKYEMSNRQAYMYIRDAYEYSTELSDKQILALKTLQLGRLEHIMDRALKRNDLKTAVTAADTINKLYGLYDNKVKVEITKDIIQFKFADQPTADEKPIDVEYEEIDSEKEVIRALGEIMVEDMNKMNE